MKFKPVAVVTALAVSGGAGAALFGGTAISTAFTSQSSHQISVAGATVNGSVTGGDFSIGGLTPGGPAVAEKIAFNNLGNTPEEAYVQLGSLDPTQYGDDDGTAVKPRAGDLDVSLYLPTGTYQGLTAATSPLVYYTGADTDGTLPATQAGGNVTLYTGDLGELDESGSNWIDVATITAGKSLGEDVYFSLASDTGNSWNGASVTLPYTVQFQDTSGVDDQAVPTAGDVGNLNGGQQVDSDGYVAPTDK